MNLMIVEDEAAIRRQLMAKKPWTSLGRYLWIWSS